MEILRCTHLLHMCVNFNLGVKNKLNLTNSIICNLKLAYTNFLGMIIRDLVGK